MKLIKGTMIDLIGGAIPCRDCGGERFVLLEDTRFISEPVGSSAIDYSLLKLTNSRCTNCNHTGRLLLLVGNHKVVSGNRVTIVI